MNVNSTLWKEPSKWHSLRLKPCYYRNGKFICMLPIKCKYCQRMGLHWVLTYSFTKLNHTGEAPFIRAVYDYYAAGTCCSASREAQQAIDNACTPDECPFMEQQKSPGNGGRHKHFRISVYKSGRGFYKTQLLIGVVLPQIKCLTWLNPLENVICNGFLPWLKNHAQQKSENDRAVFFSLCF